jgi:hypothetical protein
MPFALIVIGLLLVVTSAKDTHVQFGTQVAKDFTGENNFFVWILAIGIIGFVGYIEKLKPLSNAFLVLVLLAMVLSNSKRGDFLTLLKNGVMHPVAPTKTAQGTTTGGVLAEAMAHGMIAGIPKFETPTIAKQADITADPNMPTMSDMFKIMMMFL